MELAVYSFTVTDIIIFKDYGLYHIAIDIPQEEICIESCVNPTYQGILSDLQECIVEEEDNDRKLRIRPEAIFNIYKSVEEFKNHLTKEMEEIDRISA